MRLNRMEEGVKGVLSGHEMRFVMRRTTLDDRTGGSGQHGPAMIGAGLALLGLHLVWPHIPPVTGVAVIALGATLSTIGRSQHRSPDSIPVLLHAWVYATLYALFVGAVCDVSFRGPQRGLNGFQCADLAVSVVVMAIAARAWLQRFTALQRG